MNIRLKYSVKEEEIDSLCSRIFWLDNSLVINGMYFCYDEIHYVDVIIQRLTSIKRVLWMWIGLSALTCLAFVFLGLTYAFPILIILSIVIAACVLAQLFTLRSMKPQYVLRIVREHMDTQLIVSSQRDRLEAICSKIKEKIKAHHKAICPIESKRLK